MKMHVTMLEPDVSGDLYLLPCCCPLVKPGAEWTWWPLLEPIEEAAGHLALSSLDAVMEGSSGGPTGRACLSFRGRWDAWDLWGDSCMMRGSAPTSGAGLLCLPVLVDPAFAWRG